MSLLVENPCHHVLPEDGALAPKHVGAIHVTFKCEQQCAFSWYNKLTALILYVSLP
jgi:hypothetical protein